MFSQAHNFHISGGQFNNVQGNQYQYNMGSGLDKLNPSYQAFFDTDMGVELSRSFCTRGTRTEVLDRILAWVTESNLNDNHSGGYWMSGMAGTGKTTITMSLCKELKEIHGILAATFFCSRQIPECQDYKLVIPTLVYQLAMFFPDFSALVQNVLDGDVHVMHKKSSEQIQKLLIEPWGMQKDLHPSMRMVVVIDALDECNGIESVLGPLVSAIQNKKLTGLKFFFTSRPEQVIEEGMITKITSTQEILQVDEFVLHQVEYNLVQRDIHTYITDELHDLSLSQEQLKTLTNLSGKLFIYAATVIKSIKGGSGIRRSRTRQKERVKSFLRQENNTPEDLSKLYAGILESAIAKEEPSPSEVLENWKIIHTIISVGEPLTCYAITQLLGMNLEDDDDDNDIVENLIQRLQAVFYISKSTNLVFTFHASFPDFIMQYDQVIYNASIQHLDLTFSCFTIMEKLRFNICNLHSSLIADSEVKDLNERVAENIGETLKYCCQFWNYHFLKCSQSSYEEVLGKLELFLKQKGIYWIEAMSVMKLLPRCGEIITLLLKEIVTSQQMNTLKALVEHLHSLLIQFASSEVKDMTPHLYLSIIPFWQNNLGCIPYIHKSVKIEHQVGNWHAQDTVTINTSPFIVRSLNFAPDGTKLVLGCSDSTVRIWDASTGVQIGDSLQGHTRTVNSVAFSSDGTRIVSGSDDETVRVWDARTGAQICEPFKDHGRYINAVAISPNGTKIVSGSDDNAIQICDAQSGTRIGNPLQGHDLKVSSVAFSPDGGKIVSGSLDRTIRIWDTNSGVQVGNPLLGHSQHVTSVAFSPDGKRIVSASHDKTVRIWDAITGFQIGSALEGHESYIHTATISPDGTKVVSGSSDSTIRIWDISTGLQIGDPLDFHDKGVAAVVFSPDETNIVSSSYDETVRICNISGGIQLLTGSSPGLQGHNDAVNSVAFSPDGTTIVSGSHDKTVRIWDAATCVQVMNPLKGHENFVTTVSFSPDGKRIVSGSWDKTVRIWDVRTGTEIGAPLVGHETHIESVAFSPDGTKVVSASWDIVKIWDSKTGHQLVGDILEGHNNSRVNSVSFSPDGTLIACACKDKTVKIWNASTGVKVAAPLPNYNNGVNSVAFSPDGKQIASGSDDKTVRIWDASTCVQLGNSLQGHDYIVTSVAFSPDGRRIVSGSLDRTIRIWNANTGAQVGAPLQGHEAGVKAVAFSSDGTKVVSASWDSTIRVWDVFSDIDKGDTLQHDYMSIVSIAFSQISPANGSHIVYDYSMTEVGNTFHNQTATKSFKLAINGWLYFLDNQTTPIIWIPPLFRRNLWTNRTRFIISRNGYIKLSFKDLVYGDKWTQCIE
ncbi:quinon protein alcohol dehydrogenase-like superfamily [Lentinula edodes]|nr:quinon protein alcohol dehydrogenase-like superfamily [Lentinula edodes]